MEFNVCSKIRTEFKQTIYLASCYPKHKNGYMNILERTFELQSGPLVDPDNFISKAHTVKQNL